MELKSIRLHQVLKTISKTFVEFQKKEQIDPVSITLGNITKKAAIKAPCFFIIGDMQGRDKMTCPSLSYSNKINRLCRKCDVRGEDSGNPNIKCKNIKMKNIQKMVEQNDTDNLRALNQYNVQNAWFDVDFGGCPYGIFSTACPVEPLHALENGLISECIKVLFHKIRSNGDLAELDRLVKKLTTLPRQNKISYGADKDMPRLLWKDGITNLTDLTASQKVGIMFTIVVMSLQDDGIEFLMMCLKNQRVLMT